MLSFSLQMGRLAGEFLCGGAPQQASDVKSQDVREDQAPNEP